MALDIPKKKEKAPEVPVELRLVREVFGNVPPPPAFSTRGVNAIPTTNDDLLCGVELEIENLPEGARYYMETVGDFWNVEEDGSLRPRGQAWEFISVPARLSIALAETQRLFQVLSIDEERNYSDRCSVHIHTNVQDWTQGQLASLAMVYPVFEGALFQFVNHHKKKEEQGYCRDTNLYCIPWSDCRHNRNFVENLFTAPANIRNWQKYTALNFLPVLDKGTVEWRHLHGTCDMEKLTIWFNVIGAMMRYCKNTPFDQIVNTIQMMNDVSTYQQFFEEVLMKQLPYNEDYRRLMAEGVINAKYSLINWEVNKSKPKAAKKSIQMYLDDVVEAGIDIPVPAGGWWGDEIRRDAQLINPVNQMNNAAEQLRQAGEAILRRREEQRAARPAPGAPDPFGNLIRAGGRPARR
jgi:hypothetical protein